MSRCGAILASKVQTVTGRSNFVLSCLPKQVRRRGSRRGKKNHTGQEEGERQRERGSIVLAERKGRERADERCRCELTQETEPGKRERVRRSQISPVTQKARRRKQELPRRREEEEEERLHGGMFASLFLSHSTGQLARVTKVFSSCLYST